MVVAMASCDAQHVGMIATAYDPPDMRTSGEVPDTHVGKNGRDTRATDDRSMRRATQEVAPAVRRAVLRRDRGCCVFPGCRHATFVDIHHIVTRADGGGHDASNLVTVCSAHHRAIHEGRVIIEGSPSSGLRIRHVDGTTYGDVPGGGSASIIDARATALRALRMMGFREREVRFALARLSAQGSGDVTVEGIIRACLSYLTQGTLAQAG